MGLTRQDVPATAGVRLRESRNTEYGQDNYHPSLKVFRLLRVEEDKRSQGRKRDKVASVYQSCSGGRPDKEMPFFSARPLH